MDKLEQQEKQMLSIGDIAEKRAKDYRRTETPGVTHKKIKAGTKLQFVNLAKKVEKFVPNTKKALKIALAVATSGNKKGTPMLWMMLVGNPSAGKTEVATLIRKSINVYAVDNMTVSAFITGERPTKNKKVHDLLPNLHRKCFLIKDWTSLFNLYEDMIKKIIGDLVNIYDEEFTKFSATRGNVTYKSNFSHLGCITPATLNKHQHYLSVIGARFLFYITPDLTQEQKNESFESIFREDNRRKIKKELTKLTSKFLNKLSKLSIKSIKPLSDEVKIYLRTAAEFLARARGIVVMQASSYKNEEGESVTYYEVLDSQIEEPWRAIQQLMRLSKYLALVEEKKEVEEEELEIIKDIVLSSMPANRAKALDVFKDGRDEVTAKDLSNFTEKSVKTSRRLLDELVFLGILNKDKGAGTIANSYKIKNEFKSFVTVRPSEFMSPYNVNGEHKGEDLDETIDELFGDKNA